MLKRITKRLWRIPLVAGWLIWIGIRGISTRLCCCGQKIDRLREVSKLTRRWAAGLLRIFQITLVVHGDQELYRKTGGLVVSNHLGYMDILLQGAVFGPRFAPKQEIRHWPFFGWFVGMAEPIWIWRNNSGQHTLEMIREICWTLESKIPMVIYPEGTSTDGLSGLLPFKGAPFEAVHSGDYPIQPVLMFWEWNKTDVNPAWFGGEKFLPHLWKIFGNGPMTAHLYLLPQERSLANDRKELARIIHEKMTAEYDRLIRQLRERTA